MWRRWRFYERSGCLELDAVSVRNLELVEPLFNGESVQTTFAAHDGCLLHPHGQAAVARDPACGLRRKGERSRHGYRRCRRHSVICAGAKVCDARWTGCWIWNAC